MGHKDKFPDDLIKKHKKEYIKKNPQIYKDIRLRYVFGPDAPLKYKEFKSEGNNTCLICGGANASGRALALDHNHITGKLRGILCDNCNNGLGRFKVDQAGIEFLIKAIEYIRTHG